MSYMDRINRLRVKAIEPDTFHYQHQMLFTKYFQQDGRKWTPETYGDAYRYIFENLPVTIDEDELIVGKPIQNPPKELIDDWHDNNPLYQKFILAAGVGQDSHMAVDFELLLEKGARGIIDRIGELEKGADDGKLLFYKNCRIALESMILHSNRYADKAEELAEAAEEPRKSELLRIAKVCRRVPEYPAESFYEAVQSAHFLTYSLFLNPIRGMQQFQLGHPDRYLLPYYEKDIKEGKLTKEEAQELLDCMAIQINWRVPRGLASGYMVGGRDAKGNTVANDLTMMGMQVVDDIRLVYPGVGLCYHKDIPDEYLEKACEILSHGCSHPAIFNDDIITAGLREYGVTEEEACNYIQSTCVEITPVGASNVWVASPYTNLPQLLLDKMGREYDSFEELVSAVKDNLAESIKKNFEDYNRLRDVRNKRVRAINPLLSCFVRDCLALGIDMEKGGARYNWIMPSFVGMGNLADSLYVLKKVIFEEKRMTMAEMKAVLDKNFEGSEDLRLDLLNNYAKYGNDEDEVDVLSKEFTDFIANECKKYTPIFQNARLVPSVFCWQMHENFGSAMGASPDGRKAGFPLGDGSGPCQGRERKGPTASILSSTKWSHKEFIGGVAVNMKFSKKMFNQDSLKKVVALVKTFIYRGGFEIQINVVDRETLLKAKKNPEEYSDLVVRIGGYSDYFVKLTPNMQEEVLLRTEHEI